MPSWCREVNWGNCGIPWVNCAIVCAWKTTGKDSSEFCALPFKTAQFTKFFRQVWRYTVKSLSLTEIYRALNRSAHCQISRPIIQRHQCCSARTDGRRGRLEADSRYSRLHEHRYKIGNEFRADWRPVRLRRIGDYPVFSDFMETEWQPSGCQIMYDNLRGLNHRLCDNKGKQSR
jgi:hypothetical protein